MQQHNFAVLQYAVMGLKSARFNIGGCNAIFRPKGANMPRLLHIVHVELARVMLVGLDKVEHRFTLELEADEVST